MAADNNSKDLSYRELQELSRQFDRQLEDLSRGDQSGTASPSFKSRLAKWGLYLLFLFLGLLLPFILLIRTSVYTYAAHGLNGWVALSLGVLSTILLLLGYALFVSYRYSGRLRLNKYVQAGIAVMVLAYSIYGLVYYSGMNTKTEEIRSYYRSLHPIMRVSLSTVTFADSDIIVTDIQREPADYGRMGLSEKQHSLHYVQENGYVHAVDLRTRGRAEWQNWLMQASMELIGLQTLRHTGTADHLHVYLPLND